MGNDTLSQIWKDLLGDAAETVGDAGRDAINAAAGEAEFAAERANHLRNMIDDPGYRTALQAELDTLLLRAGLRTVEQGDKFDDRVFSIIETALNALSRAARAIVA